MTEQEQQKGMTLEQWREFALQNLQQVNLHKQIEAMSDEKIFRLSLLEKLQDITNVLKEIGNKIGNNIAEVGKILDEAQNGVQEAEPSAEDIELKQAEERLALAKANLQKVKEPVQQYSQEDYKKFDSDEDDSDIMPESEPEEVDENSPAVRAERELRDVPGYHPMVPEKPAKKKYVFKKVAQ